MTEDLQVVLPDIPVSGSPPHELREKYSNARNSAETALDDLGHVYPHPRDFRNFERYADANEWHRQHMYSLRDLVKDLLNLECACVDIENDRQQNSGGKGNA